MGEVYRYEAIVVGDDLAALFAGYLLKKNRIRFAMIKTDGINLEKLEKKKKFFYEISEEDKKMVDGVYQNLLTKVGVTDETFSDMNEKKDRLEVFLKSELERELHDIKYVSDIIYVQDQSDIICVQDQNVETDREHEDSQMTEVGNGYTVLRCGDLMISSDVVICQSDILTAGIWAQSVFKEKQRGIEESMRRLRIKDGKRTPRKMVYVTHSKNWFYVREVVMAFAVGQGAAAVNPFMNYGFYLNGAVEKDKIMECCHQFIRTVDELWVFGPVSEEILTDIAVAVMEGKKIRFFSISEQASEIHELRMEDITFEREVHAGQIRRADLLDFVRSAAPKRQEYVQMSLFD